MDKCMKDALKISVAPLKSKLIERAKGELIATINKICYESKICVDECKNCKIYLSIKNFDPFNQDK